jgi:serine/threonine-protein kinase HipA
MDLLLGSSMADNDRRDFFKTQMLFWMLCAIDGHAKNFSLYLESGGGYRLTPRYDVLSAYPVLGPSSGKLSPKKVKMAMAVEGANRHYLWYAIQPRHWGELAKRCGIGSSYGALRDEVVESTTSVIEVVESRLPKDFPVSVSIPVLEGLTQISQRF